MVGGRYQVASSTDELADAQKMLAKEKYEHHHKVRYEEDAINACVSLSERYIADKFLPDKAIDILDESGSRIHMSNLNIPDSIIKLEKKLMKLAKDKSNAISSQKFETAAQIRDKERKVKIKLE